MRRPALFLACATLLAGCEVPSLGMPDPVSKEGQRIDSLWSGFVVASFLVFGLVVGLILYAAIRFRRKNDDVPSQKPYNVPMEVLYTVTPIVVVAGLFGFSVAAQLDVTKTTPVDEAVVVNVTSFQWGWRFEFPEQGKVVEGAGEVSPPTIEVPVNRSVHFVLRTEDVNHAFWVPQFLEKRDLIRGIDNTLDITPNQLGEYGGKCAEFCGLDHWRMPFTIRVVTQPEFDAWVRSR
ncbi:MAG TPA: cytochrome c oxidase subunit II [Acidimicrobiales bacterium]|nr:cytochrome c oxidase subunit II [Acidimicrobiales bacterium]